MAAPDRLGVPAVPVRTRAERVDLRARVVRIARPAARLTRDRGIPERDDRRRPHARPVRPRGAWSPAAAHRHDTRHESPTHDTYLLLGLRRILARTAGLEPARAPEAPVQ